eukprot:TRINITY_DN40025_c0_g1_i1.p1 TRINITY_DN40025_c0_g1~~TRINITY_DN40025_c0_g1_i1.p1  ORF type:complete len:245 (+),score=38.04 TRINITY_DN40025_c0_g1_i1:118-852(+)
MAVSFFSFTWCCAPTSGNKANSVEDPTGNEMVHALPLSSSSHAKFPARSTEVSSPLTTPGHHEAEKVAASSAEGMPMPTRSSAPTSTPFGLSAADAKAPAGKAKLQQLVREFAKAAINGLRVETISEETGKISDTWLYMDRYLYTMRFLNCSSGEDRQYVMKDMIAMFKGQEFEQVVPSLADRGLNCLAMDFSVDNDFRVCLHFQDADQRDQFYTCMKIFRMSVDMSSAKRDESLCSGLPSNDV